MARISITGIEEGVKRGLKAACAVTGQDMSTVLRDRLPRVIAEVEGVAPTIEELHAAILDLSGVILSYKARRLQDAEVQFALLRQRYPWIKWG